MPARKDFAVIHNEALSDPRFDRLGEALVGLNMAVPITAADTARGLASRLWLWCLRSNDPDGYLPGDGLGAARAAFGLGPVEAKAVLDAMGAAGLLEPGKWLRVKGFRDSYKALLYERTRTHGRSGNVPGTSAESSAPTVAVAVPKPNQESPSTTTATAGAESPNGKCCVRGRVPGTPRGESPFCKVCPEGVRAAAAYKVRADLERATERKGSRRTA